ncbi:substrate-binding domain-containing protein [Actinoplanes sp. NPDC051411]|uniref:sugar ABC transporter substrate-binding protein n=1 Tax=Actinoplanes sp. NPDC051411 TaxID=3155522 RepID=UPI00342E86B5
MLRRLLAPVAIAMTALATAAACTQGSPATDTRSDAKDLSIAFLMPCSTCADRFESKDKPYFEDAVKQLDRSIKVIANNAQGDAAVQLQQAESALTNGAKVIVVSPFTAETGASIVAKADAAGAKVVAYDGAIEGAVPAAYVSFRNEKVGELQGQYLLDKLPKGATVAFVNGDITSAPGRDFKAGAHKILDPAFADGRLKLGYEADTAGFDPAKGQAEMEQGLTKLNDKVQGVIAPNDGLANAVITALTARKLNGRVLVTGQDATDPGLQAIVAGNQSMTVYKSIRDEATAAAKIAVALAKADTAGAASLTTTTVDNGSGKVPALLLDPVVVTKDNIADVVIKDGYTTKDKICAGEAAAKCDL